MNKKDILKSLGDSSQNDSIIQKGKWNVGDEKVYQGVTYFVSGFNDKGAPKWQKRDKNKKSDSQSSAQATAAPKSQSSTQSSTQKTTAAPASTKKVEDMTPDELVSYAKSTSTDALAKVVNDKKQDTLFRQLAFNELKTRKDYDKTKVDSSDLQGGYIAKPTAKVQYKTKKIDIPEDEIEYPTEWDVPVLNKNTGAKSYKKRTVGDMRKLYANVSDADLLKVLNNQKNRFQERWLAYDEAAARGIDEDKIDVSGTLQKEWDKQKRKYEMRQSMNAQFNPDEAAAPNIDFKGFDHEAFMKPFLESGDPGWRNPDDQRVQKQFGGFKTLTQRQQYDALKSYYEPMLPGYLNPQNKLGLLNEQYENFIKYKTTVLFVSAGGAGVGKTYGWEQVAKDNACVKLDSDANIKNTDWGYVMCSDPDDEEDFRRVLAKYNGTYQDHNSSKEKPHILVFDDADKIINSPSPALKATMKKITDNNPKNRIFINPDTKKPEVFRGAILIMTNKDLADLMKKEDTKAILTRGQQTNIQLTREESMSVIRDRYKKMALSDFQEAFEDLFPDEDDQMKVREEIFSWIEDNYNDADPRKFSPRTFIQVMQIAAPAIANGDSGVRFTASGVQVGADVPWQIQALDLIKAQNNDIEKAFDYDEEEAVKVKKELLASKKKAKKNKKRYNTMYGNAAMDAYYFGNSPSETKETTEKTQKSFEDEMTLEDAESLLFG